ncbi:MAG TPA: acyltransferase [Thermoanaerobaculia bacterium]|nr:acyltransferase [Thermoanaerobaculia bacterium]
MSLVPLSPIDTVFTGRGAYPIEFVFAYDGTIDAGRLEESLRRVLTAFPPAGSRFVRLPDGSLAFEPYEGGCTFRVAQSPTDYADTERKTIFLDPVDGREGEPLGRVLLTRTPNGCILGVSLSHAVADGYSYFYFLSSWARLFRGEPFPPPSHAREALVPPFDGPTKAPGFLDAGGLFRAGPRPEVDRAHLRIDRHVLSRAELVAMHEEAQAGNPVRLSHNDTAAAWLWKKCLVEWTDPDPSLDTYLSCPVDFRRLHPAVGSTYFGNAVVLATASIPRGELAAAPLGDLATRVRRAVDAVDTEAVRRSLLALERLRRAEGLGAMEECHVVHPRQGLLLTNLSRLPVPEVAFDAGPPVAFDILTPGVRGAVALPEPGGGIDLRVFLPVA